MVAVLIGDSLLPSLCERGHFPPGTDLVLYEVKFCSQFLLDCQICQQFKLGRGVVQLYLDLGYLRWHEKVDSLCHSKV